MQSLEMDAVYCGLQHIRYGFVPHRYSIANLANAIGIEYVKYNSQIIIILIMQVDIEKIFNAVHCDSL